MMKDSSLVYGEKADAPIGGLSKNVVKLDGKSIPSSEVLGFQHEGYFYAKGPNPDYPKEYAKRYVQGRISVYVSIRYTGPSHSLKVCFFQKGNGPLRESIELDELKQMLSDCKKAYDMVNIPHDQYVKAVKKDPYFIQHVVQVYNSCGEWK
jgi:hypothetical protein